MEQFEKYHPIMTPRFTFDWLTVATVKDVFAIRHDPAIAAQANRPADADINQTVTFISQTMVAVMRNQQLTWGITDRAEKRFVGIFALDPIDPESGQAGLHLELQPALVTPPVVNEIIGHMSAFAFAELGLHSLTIWVPTRDTATKDALAALGYKPAANTEAGAPADFDLYQISRAVSIVPPVGE